MSAIRAAHAAAALVEFDADAARVINEMLPRKLLSGVGMGADGLIAALTEMNSVAMVARAAEVGPVDVIAAILCGRGHGTFAAFRAAVCVALSANRKRD